ncbi:MAG: DUF4367 domain-containing protein [Clostridia bacterium]|nr:DUF4367 domain-containing protein [Clostridia bacterium]
MKANDSRGYTAMRRALMPHVTRMTEEIAEEESMSHEYREETMNRIHHIMEEKQPGRSGKLGQRLAVACLAALLLAGVTSAAVEPIRERIANAFLGQWDSLVTADFDDTGDSEKIVLMKPGYIPEGFELTETKAEYGSLDLVYENGEGGAVYFSRQEYNDDEKAEILWSGDAYTAEETVIGGNACILLKPARDDVRPSVSWTDDGYLYIIETTLPADGLIRIAEGMVTDRVIGLTEPAWMPAGYRVSDVYEFRTNYVQITYENADGRRIHFRREALYSPGERGYDSRYTRETVSVNGRDAVLLRQSGYEEHITIIWEDENFRYNLSGWSSEEELIRTAESVK